MGAAKIMECTNGINIGLNKDVQCLPFLFCGLVIELHGQARQVKSVSKNEAPLFHLWIQW